MGAKISVQIEKALLGKPSDEGISALGIDSGRMTGNSEVIGVTVDGDNVRGWLSAL